MTLLSLQEDMSAWLKSEAEEVAARFGRSARRGLAVYLNNYRSQLMGCLSSSYPVLRAWLGEAAFDVAAATHIERVPPHAWTLDAYSLGFPETLARLYPSDPEVTELGQFERELEAVFVECDCAPLNPAALGDVDWDAASVRFVPTLRILSMTTNVTAIWSAIRAGENPPAVEQLEAPPAIVIWRDGFVPRFRALDADEAGAIDQLRAGKSFAEVCQGLVARLGEERGTVLAGSWFGQWLAGRMVAGFEVLAA